MARAIAQMSARPRTVFSRLSFCTKRKLDVLASEPAARNDPASIEWPSSTAASRWAETKQWHWSKRANTVVPQPGSRCNTFPGSCSIDAPFKNRRIIRNCMIWAIAPTYPIESENSQWSCTNSANNPRQNHDNFGATYCQSCFSRKYYCR